MCECVICGSRALSKLYDVFDDRYGYPGTFALLQCGSCGHAFLRGEFPPELLRDLYSNYYPRATFDLERYQPYQEKSGLKAWLAGEKCSAYRWVPRNVRVLDIGCGFGESLGYHRARGCDVYGVEADENIRRVSERFGYKVHVGLFDPGAYEANFFDFVTMGQVIEHVTNPVQTLRGIAQVLKPGGVAILSTPNTDGWGAKVFCRRWINWHAPYHLQFFTPYSMQLAAEQAGLVVERTITITPSAWLHFQWLHLLMYPPEGKPSIFWAPGGTWSLMQRLALKGLTIAHRLKLDHVITRVFDALGLGDNRLFFLRKP
jgi:SAM-dependent methyltransferase